MPVQLTPSCELMTEFHHSRVVASDSVFQALQTDSGHSLLFSVDSGASLVVVTESPGTPTGWVRVDLSAGPCSGGGRVKTFAAGQNHRTGSIDLLAVITTEDGQDEVHASLGNSAADLGWLRAPVWIALPYDDDRPRTGVVDVFVSDAADAEYLVVDVRRDADSGLVFRYFLDPTPDGPVRGHTNRVWNPNDVAVDLEIPTTGAAGASSCLGRRSSDRVEGIYSLGSLAGESVLNYQKLYDPQRLRRHLSGTTAVTFPVPPSTTGLASVRMGDADTDLYVVADRTLYRWAADEQDDGRAPTRLHSHDLFAGATALHGLVDATRVVLFGHSRSGTLFTTSCPLASLADPSAWSPPLPLLSRVAQISPYLNRSDGGRTFFAATGDAELTKLFHDERSGTWSTQRILVPVPPETKPTAFTSYTTRVHVSSDGTPVPGATVSLTASRRTAVTVDHLYFVLDRNPLPVTTDATGTITIVEAAQGLHGTTLTVEAADGATVTITPTDAPMARAGAALGTPKQPGDPDPVVVDDTGGERPLLAPGTSDDDRATLTTAVSGLVTAYDQLSSTVPAVPAVPAVLDAGAPDPATGLVVIASVGVGTGVPTAAPAPAAEDLAAAVEVDAGDLLRALGRAAEDAVDFVVHVVQDAGDRTWHVVCEIAGSALRFVIDIAQKAVGAILAVIAAVVQAVEDFVDFLKLVFAWKDITRTQKVLKNLMMLSARHGIDQLGALRTDLDTAFTGLVATIEQWAQPTSDRWKQVGGTDVGPRGTPTGVDGTATLMCHPGGFLAHKITPNVAGARPPSSRRTALATGDGTTDPAEELVEKVVAALKAEGQVLVTAARKVRDVLVEADHRSARPLSVGEVAVALVGVVVEVAATTARVFFDLLIDILVVIAEAVLTALDEPIWIPVVSDVLAHFDITIELSMFDIMCYAAAVPVTAVYKAAMTSAPFSADDGFSDGLINATRLTQHEVSSSRPQEVPA